MHYIKVRTVGKLSGDHQAAIMVIGVDQSDDKDIVITGSKDHYIKVRTVGKLSGCHQAAIIVIGVDQSDDNRYL